MSTSSTPTLPSGFVVARTTTSSSTAICTIAVPGKYGHVDDLSACNAYWSYNPSFAAAILFSVLFGILTIAHIFQGFYYKKCFTWVMIMGASWELFSFITRTLGTRKQQSLSLIIISQLLFLLAPLWINAFAYMTLGRLIHFFHPRRRCLGVKACSIAKYFVWADIFSFLVQGSGGSMLGPGNSANTQKIGLKVYMGGVGIQEGFIVLFILLTAKFQKDMQHLETNGQGRPDRRGWKLQVWNMYAVLALITMRIIFRLCEFTRGTDPDNPMLHHEAYIYTLDAMPMFFAILFLSVFHPARVLVGPDSEFPRLSRKEKKALKREKKEEKRRKRAERKGSKSKGMERGYTVEEYGLRRVDTESGNGARRDEMSTGRHEWGVVI